MRAESPTNEIPRLAKMVNVCSVFVYGELFVLPLRRFSQLAAERFSPANYHLRSL